MEENKKIYYIGVAFGVLLVFALCWYLLREPDIHNQRERSNDVRTELSNIGTAQRDVKEHIDNAGRGIDRSVELADEIAGGIGEAESRITDSAERNAECAELVADSERRITESRAILQAVRKRARQDGK